MGPVKILLLCRIKINPRLALPFSYTRGFDRITKRKFIKSHKKLFRYVFYEQYLLKVMGVHFTKIFLVVLQNKMNRFFMKWLLVFYLLLHSPWPQRLNLNVTRVLKMSFEVRKKMQKVCNKMQEIWIDL